MKSQKIFMKGRHNLLSVNNLDDIRLVAIKCFLKFRPSGVEHKAVKNIDNCAMDDLD